jgi:4-hydroxybenzoate polyprenyltransferase
MSRLSSLRREQEPPRHKKVTQAGPFRSQIILFSSRKRWGLLYSLATLAGIFFVPGVAGDLVMESDIPALLQRIALLPAVTILIATGMYILNDLVDADLDRANGKKRPIPSGLVSKNQALFFVLWTNTVAALLSFLTLSSASPWIVIAMLSIGIMYSAPRVALMNRFLIKTLSIAVFYSICAILGITSSYGLDRFLEEPAVPVYAMTLLGIMIFVSSTLNDLGDMEGDRVAGRKTIPVVFGSSATIKFLTLLSLGMVATSIVAVGYVGLITVMVSALYTAVVISRLRKILEGIIKMDAEGIRRQHRKFLPLHFVLQLFLAIAAVALM